MSDHLLLTKKIQQQQGRGGRENLERERERDMGGGTPVTDNLPPAGGVDADQETSSASLSSSEEQDLLHDPHRAQEESEEDTAWRRRRRYTTFLELVKSYETIPSEQHLEEAKASIKRHKPGDWIDNFKAGDYQLPEAITLLLIGPRGSGKSSLVNRITRVLEDNPYPLDRAQVSYNMSATHGSCFLQEYMVPRNSSSLCVYDTRSLSLVPSDNFKLLKRWMTQGVTHGELVIRDSDVEVTRKRMKAMSRQGYFASFQKRSVNFVVFVINGVSVLKSMDNKETQYTDMVVETFNYPFLSFKDSKPVVVVTHGDELSFTDRARVRTYMAELLGIPPYPQIFDIPDTSSLVTELGVVDMLRYSIMQADRNLPSKQNLLLELGFPTLSMPLPVPGQRILQMMVDKLQGFDAIILTAEVLIICTCFIILILRFTES